MSVSEQVHEQDQQPASEPHLICPRAGGRDGRLERLDNRVVEALQAAGWFVVRLTGREIRRRPAECLARIRRALERAQARSAK